MVPDASPRAHLHKRLDPPRGREALAETASPHLLQRCCRCGPFHLAGQGGLAPSFDVWRGARDPAVLSTGNLAGIAHTGAPRISDPASSPRLKSKGAPGRLRMRLLVCSPNI